MEIRINGLERDYYSEGKRIRALNHVNLTIPANQIFTLLGPSGCGKTTTLRMIAGLESITSGDVFIGDRLINKLPAKDRNIAMVFQNYALYPHMTVYKNMAYGLRIRRMPKAEIDERVRNAAKILELTEFLDRKPRQLSGGQRQRVAMGRCIVREPKVFLFDEPLSNLDAKLRVQMRLEIRNLHEDLKITSIYVTHDQVEAMTLGDRLIVMDNGYAAQIGSPLDVYEHPATRFVAGFIGSPAMNFLDVRLSPGGDAVELPGDIELPLANGHNPEHGGKEVVMGIRPEHFELADKEAATLHLKVDHVELLGADTLVHGHYGENKTLLTLRLTDIQHFKKNTMLPLIVPPQKIHLFDKETGNRIGK